METNNIKTNLIVSRILLFVSFALVNVITTGIAIRGTLGMMFGLDIEQLYYYFYVLTILLSAGLSMLLFELLSKYYFAFTTIRKGYCLPTDIFKLVHRLRYYFIARNVVLALVSILYIFYPILYIKGNSLFSAVVTLSMVFVFYFDVKKKYLINTNAGTIFDLTWPIMAIETVLLVWGLL